mgnify:CR=1 FL=1|jgi:hypothetical protein
MIDSIKDIIISLNSYAGLFSLLALLAAIVVPIAIYQNQRKNEKQDLQDELDTLNEFAGKAMYDNAKQHFIRKTSLEKKLKRK